MNKVILLGRLGNDPELNYTNSGTPVAKFSIATSKTWNDKNGERQEKTQWHRIVVWSKLAELCSQYLKKGSQCFIEGELDYQSWDDDQGNKHYATDIIATNVRFLDGKDDG